MKVLLKNGTIYDGTGAAPYTGDLLIENDKIIEVSPSIAASDVTIVDMTGKSIAPGFIDAHSHNDWFAIKNDPLPFFEPFVKQGITSFITGNCGISVSGCPENSPHKDTIGAGLFNSKATTRYISNIRELFDEIDNNSPVNIAAGIGHCTARAAISGYENRALTPQELQTMLDVIDRDLSDGACLASLGLMYEPGIYASFDELKEVAKLCLKHNKPLTVHPRACSAVSLAYGNPFGRPHLLRALDELYEMTKDLKGIKLQYSHLIFVGRKSFKTENDVLSIFDKMRADGVNLMFDLYSEIMGVSVITAIAPAWWLSMTSEQKKNPWIRFKFKTLITITKKLLGFEFSDIIIAHLGPDYEKYEGKNVSEIAKDLGMSDFEAYIHLCEISRNKGRVNMGPYSTPEIISRLAKRSDVLYMTDAWIEEEGIQNPAAFDCFPKFLHLALNGKGDSVAHTVRKMSGATADRYMLQNRGYLKSGYFADITVFDEQELKNGTPDRFNAFGISDVYINGKHVLHDGEIHEKELRFAGSSMRV